MEKDELLMFPFPVKERQIAINHLCLTLLIPEGSAVQAWYDTKRRADRNVLFPYWSKLWPAALGLCHFVAVHPYLVAGKKVLEIAAGLGLPSLLAAIWARQVTCTDIAPEAMQLAKISARKNNLLNLQARTFDWNHVPTNMHADVLLLSDINYDPDVFDQLFSLLLLFMQRGSTILLSTPQRLMAKPFIMRLLPYCTARHTETVTDNGSSTEVSIYVLTLHGQHNGEIKKNALQ